MWEQAAQSDATATSAGRTSRSPTRYPARSTRVTLSGAKPGSASRMMASCTWGSKDAPSWLSRDSTSTPARLRQASQGHGVNSQQSCHTTTSKNSNAATHPTLHKQ